MKASLATFLTVTPTCPQTMVRHDFPPQGLKK